MTSNRWFEVYITDGLDKYYEKTTILGIFILTLKGRGEPLSTSEIDIYILPRTSNEIWTLVQDSLFQGILSGHKFN